MYIYIYIYILEINKKSLGKLHAHLALLYDMNIFNVYSNQT